MGVVDQVLGRLLDHVVPEPFKYSLMVRGVMTGPTAWRFTFDYANAMSRPVILVEAILKFTFFAPGEWEPIAKTKHFIDHPHYGANEKRDIQERSQGVRVVSADIEFPKDLAFVAGQPETVHEILSMTDHAEISLRVRAGGQIHPTGWYAYDSYGQTGLQEVRNRLRSGGRGSCRA